MNALVLVAVPPTVVTARSFTPMVPAGLVAVMLVAVDEDTVAATPPIFTVAPERLVPAILMAVPPASGPELGVTVAIVGSATYVNALALVAVPPTVVTVRSLAPAEPAGVFAVMLVAVTADTVAAMPPIFTVAPARLVPAIVMTVPPTSGPELGETVAIVGSAT